MSRALLLAVAPILCSAAQFDVATVKQIDPAAPHMVGITVNPGARVVLSGLSLKGMIVAAFDVGSGKPPAASRG